MQKIKVGDKVKIVAIPHFIGIVRHIGILLGIGRVDSVWSDWSIEHFDGRILPVSAGGTLSYATYCEIELIKKGNKIIKEFPFVKWCKENYKQ